MRIAVFDTHRFERSFLEEAAARHGHELVFFEPKLSEQTAQLAQGFEAVCAFVNDRLSAPVLQILATNGVKLVALRSAGFNNVDLPRAEKLKIRVARVPEYSPYAVAEHAVALVLALNRKTYRAYSRVREMNFSLDGLVGFDLHRKTVGVVGTGKIGAVFARIMKGFGCRILAFDKYPDQKLAAETGAAYVSLDEIYAQSDIISLHVPLTPGTRHLISARSIPRMKPGVMLINTGRGALIDTKALIDALKTGQVGYAGLDVYEEEETLFFQDLSGQVLQDDTLARLLTFPNVVITSHQAFLTKEALQAIAETTMSNARQFEEGLPLTNEVRSQTAPGS